MEYQIFNRFMGYRSKTDETNLEPAVLVSGSQNVLMNDGDRIQLRKGYTLDGDASSDGNPIVSSFDWIRHLGDERNIRTYDDEMEYRYVASDGTVTWRKLADGFTADATFNFAVYWDDTELIERLLFVDGTSNIYDWSGGIATIDSTTTNTITKEGTTTWAQEGFYTAGTRTVEINGTTYTYTGGEGTTTLTGVTPDPTGEADGSIVHQTIRTTANSAITSLPNALLNSLIDVKDNQVYIGSLVDHSVYVSKQNDFTDFAFASPRAPGEGALLTLDAPPKSFITQEEFEYISAGEDFWYKVGFQLSSDNTKETMTIERLETTSKQAARSQAATTKMKNFVAYISEEPTMDTLGQVVDVLTPQTTNLSDRIKTDFDAYNFTNVHILYNREFLYIALPSESLVLIYNIAKGFHEAPQVLPVRRLAIIGGELYGHSSTNSETFKLFDGVNDNGQAIEGIAKFSYLNGGKRANKKVASEWYTEGYMTTNTVLTHTRYLNYKGCESIVSEDLKGTDTNIVCSAADDGSLGKKSLGKRSLAGRGATADVLPPKFRAIIDAGKVDFYEVQIEYRSIGEDMTWELLAFGSNMKISSDNNQDIKANEVTFS